MDDYRDLDSLFVLPDHIKDHWRTDYEVLVARLRNEARGLPMNTIQQLLIERIAGLYIEIRWRESLKPGSAHSFSSAGALQANKDWLGLAREFNSALVRLGSVTSEALLGKVKTAIQDAVVEAIQDTPTRTEFMSRLSSGFASQGL